MHVTSNNFTIGTLPQCRSVVQLQPGKEPSTRLESSQLFAFFTHDACPVMDASVSLWNVKEKLAKWRTRVSGGGASDSSGTLQSSQG
jgi:hypothetical protein